MKGVGGAEMKDERRRICMMEAAVSFGELKLKGRKDWRLEYNVMMAG